MFFGIVLGFLAHYSFMLKVRSEWYTWRVILFTTCGLSALLVRLSWASEGGFAGGFLPVTMLVTESTAFRILFKNLSWGKSSSKETWQ